ncbi:hypothetical protein MYA_5671 [Burkholderia sp. KJ006]|nr:hypothetical protein MYA_5671 [Burkholderia sp. KJ006]
MAAMRARRRGRLCRRGVVLFGRAGRSKQRGADGGAPTRGRREPAVA